MTLNSTPYLLTSEFDPIPKLTRVDADIMLFFLQGNRVVFLEPIDDLWYRATVPARNLSTVLAGEGKPTWRLEEAASPLGYTLQLQFCNIELPGDNRCRPLASQADVFDGALELFNVLANGTAEGTNGVWFNWLGSEVTESPLSIVNTLGLSAALPPEPQFT